MKAFEIYQYLDGEQMTERDKNEFGSKFWNKGKWDNFIAPFLPAYCKELTFVDVGCNAGLFLKFAEERGFKRVIGVDGNKEAVERGLAWRDKHGGKYKIIHSPMEKCLDLLPLADFTLLSNAHYYFTINDWFDYLDKLQYQTRYCIIVTGEKKHKNVCWASADVPDIRSYFKNWDEVGFIDEISREGDPSPRRLWALCFKSRYLDRVPVKHLLTRNPQQEGFCEEIDKGIRYQDTKYYKLVKEYRKRWSENRLGRWMEERIAIFKDVKENHLKKPIIIDSGNLILDGNHRYSAIKYLGDKSVFVRRTHTEGININIPGAEEIKLNLGFGARKLEGFTNLDKMTGWFFQYGLPQYGSGTVHAITLSHSLMFLTNFEIKTFLQEACRVLRHGGVIRITEDDTENPLSDTYKTGYVRNHPSSLLGPVAMRKFLENAGFKVHDVDEKTTHFHDKSLMQNYHRGRPRCFFIEGIKV